MSHLDWLARDEVRTALLVAELGGWLHMINKMDSHFLAENAADFTGQKSRANFANRWRSEHPAFTKLLETDLAPLLEPLYGDGRTDPITLKDLVKYHRERNPRHKWKDFLKVVNDAHGMASAAEKGPLPEDEGKQLRDATYLANPFGYEDSAGVPNPDKIRRRLLPPLTQALGSLFAEAQSPGLSKEAWWQYRYQRQWGSSDQPRGLVSLLSHHLRRVLAETRRPDNDVTLWDQSYLTAAMLKAALVSQKKDPPFQWRFLRVYFGGIQFLSCSYGVPDLLGRRRALEQAQHRVRCLLEVDYPLGTEVYRDEDNQVFLVPDFNDLLGWHHQGDATTLKRMIQEAFAEALAGEIWPRVFLGQPSRTAGNLWQVLRKPLALPTPHPERVMLPVGSGETGELCIACGLRPRERRESNKPRNLCKTCQERRTHRLREWRDREQPSCSNPTIWITETADGNGRVALVSARFDLQHWLSGLMVSTLAGRDVHQLAHSVAFADLVGEAEAGLKSGADWKKEESIGTALERLPARKGLKPDNPVNAVYEALVKGREWAGADPPDPRQDPAQAAKLLANALYSKHASFARLRRIWDTTQAFWPDEAELIDPRKRRTVRLRLQGQAYPCPHRNQTYELTLVGIRVNLLPLDQKGTDWVLLENPVNLARKLGLTLTADDTDRSAAERVSAWFREQRPQRSEPLSLRVPDTSDTLTFTPHRLVAVDDPYPPAIPLLASPQLFMALIPADEVDGLIGRLEERYTRLFGKVRGRLPLHVSVAVFGSRQPLYLAMDAVRRMQRRSSIPNAWKVRSMGLTSAADTIRWTYELQDPKGEQTIRAAFPALLGDAYTIDPYLFLPVKRAALPAKGGTPTWEAFWLSEGERETLTMTPPAGIGRGDEIFYAPSTVDIEHLDSSARRYDLVYDAEGRRQPTESGGFTGPYVLEEWPQLTRLWRLLCRLTATQRHQLVHLIESQRSQWSTPGHHAHDWRQDETFRTFAVHTLARAGDGWWGSLTRADRELLIDWAVSGRLTQAYRLFARILRRDEEGETDERE